jgi:hypothetical protein
MYNKRLMTPTRCSSSFFSIPFALAPRCFDIRWSENLVRLKRTKPYEEGRIVQKGDCNLCKNLRLQSRVDSATLASI